MVAHHKTRDQKALAAHTIVDIDPVVNVNVNVDLDGNGDVARSRSLVDVGTTVSTVESPACMTAPS